MTDDESSHIASFAMRGATRRPRALVLGCGPAGAACALALASDWDVEIARAASDAPGFGWLLMPNGVEALRALDALDRAIKGVREIRRATIVDPRGERADERFHHLRSSERSFPVSDR